jgi:hypothetical protein
MPQQMYLTVGYNCIKTKVSAEPWDLCRVKIDINP